jgi:hypothetical protein
MKRKWAGMHCMTRTITATTTAGTSYIRARTHLRVKHELRALHLPRATLLIPQLPLLVQRRLVKLAAHRHAVRA